MAEAIARHTAADVIEASSAGLMAMGFIAKPTMDVLTERHYPTDGLKSKGLTREALASADLVINMSGRAVDAVVPGEVPVEDWDVGDPYGADPAIYRRICEEIEERVKELAERLRKGGGGS